MRVGRGRRRGIRLGIRWSALTNVITVLCSIRTCGGAGTKGLAEEGRSCRIRGDCTTCSGMYGNGARTGWTPIPVERSLTPRGRPKARTVCSAAVPAGPAGTASPGTAGQCLRRGSGAGASEKKENPAQQRQLARRRASVMLAAARHKRVVHAPPRSEAKPR